MSERQWQVYRVYLRSKTEDFPDGIITVKEEIGSKYPRKQYEEHEYGLFV